MKNYLEEVLDVFERGTVMPIGRISRMICDVPADIVDKGDMYVIEANVGGFKKEEISVEYKDDILSISGSTEIVNDGDNTGKYLVKERTGSSFSRKFRIPNIKENEIKAKMENGVLTITLPKEEVPTSKITIE